MSDIRLQRYLAQCGVASRRKSELLIVEGRVRVNRTVVTELGTKVSIADKVTVDGAAVYPKDLHYVVLNKPKGVITSLSDPEGRPTVMHYIPGVPVRVMPVGRLDFYSEGVLLLTNDGQLAARLTAARYNVEKTYHVKVRGKIKPAHVRALRTGVTLDDGAITAAAEVDVLPSSSKHDWLVMTITEGKNRQIRRMLDAFNYQVNKLQRVAFAGITFHGLRIGDARELTQGEVNDLRKRVNLPPNTGSRGTWSMKREDTELARRAHEREREAAEELPPAERSAERATKRAAERAAKPPAKRPTKRPTKRPAKRPAARRPRKPRTSRR